MSRQYEDFMRFEAAAAKEINIRDELENVDQSLIVIDIRSLPIYKLFHNEELCGGRFEKIYECCESFFKKLSTLNAKLVFFTQMISDMEVAGKLNFINNITAQNSIIDDVKEGKNLSDIVEYYSTEVKYNIANLKIGILKIASKYGRIERCINKINMAREICAFAVENKAYAIITSKRPTYFIGDDLLIWYSGRMCMINFTTTQFDTGIARKYLNLEKHHMPVLGTLLGNHIIPGRLLAVGFYKNGGTSVESCATFILENEVIRIVARIFREKNFTENLNLMQQSINYYKNREEKPIDSDHEFFLKNSSSQNYKIFYGHKLIIVCEFYDYENSSLPYSEIVRPLYEKRAGILLSHKKNPSDIKYASYGNTGYFVGSFQPVYPKHIPVPPIQQLWTAGAELDDIRFKLISWVISADLDPEDIKEINPRYLPDALTLRYLTENNHITSSDGDAILLSVDAVIQGKIADDFKPPTKINEDAMHLAFLYLGVRYFIAGTMEAAGFKNVEPIRFDGFFFQQFYKDWMKMSLEIKNRILKNYQHLDNIFSLYK